MIAVIVCSQSASNVDSRSSLILDKPRHLIYQWLGRKQERYWASKMIRNSDSESDRCRREMVDENKGKGATNYPTTSPLLRWTLVPIGDSRHQSEANRL
jgi:hypothetical protein